MAKITDAIVRMYRTGTGDCFVVKFLAGDTEKYTMMIDGGTWSGEKTHLEKYVVDLKSFVNNHIDLLVITHEHKDHVYLFDACNELFTKDFKVDRIWMAWTENDATKKVGTWQKEYGDKKKALAKASDKLNKALSGPDYEKKMAAEYNGVALAEARKNFAEVVNSLNSLHSEAMAANGQYVGGLTGMKVVKETIAKKNIEYYNPGDIIRNIPKLDGIRFYVLGPPLTWDEVKVETGAKGESYEHNKDLSDNDAFALAVSAETDSELRAILPFDDSEVLTDITDPSWLEYQDQENTWRSIDNDWLFSAGSLALRMNSITNNLSLALAIEFEESGRVMLFPGDAEYGSWASWHKIPWSDSCRNGKAHLTEDLLSRTVFYKVAHHLSHHGTAERLGAQMMTHPDLASMATLDYSVISSNWKSTMPNRALLKDLIKQSKGRLMIMNEENLFYDKSNAVSLANRIVKEREGMTKKIQTDFDKAFKREELFLQYKVKGTGIIG